MHRSFALGILAVLLHVATPAAQQSGRWGDELPPAPAAPDSLFAIPGFDTPIRWRFVAHSSAEHSKRNRTTMAAGSDGRYNAHPRAFG